MDTNTRHIPTELVEQARAFLDLEERSDRAFRRYAEGKDTLPRAQRLANRVERAGGNLDRAAWAAGLDPAEVLTTITIARADERVAAEA